MGMIDNIFEKLTNVGEEVKEQTKTFVDRCCKNLKKRKKYDEYEFN